MKIVSKPIKTIAIFHYDDGTPMPYKFKYKDKMDEEKVVVVDNILGHNKTRIAGVDSIVYRCQSTIDDLVVGYELKYIIPKCKWVLYRI